MFGQPYRAAWADDSGSAPDSVSLVNQGANTPSLFSFDYGVPTSPALALLGLGSSKLKASNSLKHFVLSLSNLAGTGAGASSAALDAAPAWMFGQSRSISPDDYANSYLDQLEYKTRLGVALYRGDDAGGDVSKQKVSRIAASLSMSLLRSSDPLTALAPGSKTRAWDACLKKNDTKIRAAYYFRFGTDAQVLIVDLGKTGGRNDAYINALSSAEQAALASQLEVLEKQYNKVTAKTASGVGKTKLTERYAADVTDVANFLATAPDTEKKADADLTSQLAPCQKEASTAAEHGADLQLALGLEESGQPGQIKGFGNPNFVAWLGGRVPLTARSSADNCGDKDPLWISLRCFMVGASVHYSNGEIDATGDKTTPQAKFNLAEAWGGIEQTNTKWTLGAYAGYMKLDATDPSLSKFSKSGVRWLVDAGVPLAFIGEGVWLVGSYGQASGSATALDDKMFLLSLSLGPPKVTSLFGGSSGS
jgi:hypothetical protein